MKRKGQVEAIRGLRRPLPKASKVIESRKKQASKRQEIRKATKEAAEGNV